MIFFSPESLESCPLLGSALPALPRTARRRTAGASMGRGGRGAMGGPVHAGGPFSPSVPFSGATPHPCRGPGQRPASEEAHCSKKAKTHPKSLLDSPQGVAKWGQRDAGAGGWGGREGSPEHPPRSLSPSAFTPGWVSSLLTQAVNCLIWSTPFIPDVHLSSQILFSGV